MKSFFNSKTPKTGSEMGERTQSKMHIETIFWYGHVAWCIRIDILFMDQDPISPRPRKRKEHGATVWLLTSKGSNLIKIHAPAKSKFDPRFCLKLVIKNYVLQYKRFVRTCDMALTHVSFVSPLRICVRKVFCIL